MTHFNYGNFNKDNDFSLYQIGSQKKRISDAQTMKPQEKIEINFETKKTEAASLDALSNYGLAISGLGKNPDVTALGLTQNDQAIVGRFVTPEQQARISDDMLAFFA